MLIIRQLLFFQENWYCILQLLKHKNSVFQYFSIEHISYMSAQIQVVSE